MPVKNKIPLIMAILLAMANYTPALAQVREYRIHNRGMLHETVFNTGTIGRPWEYTGSTIGAAEQTDVPLFEWPPYSKTVINGVEYSGQHNIIGGGIYVTANEKGKKGWENRIFAFCGGIGTSSGPTLPSGQWSYPLSIEKVENFPLIVGSDGYGMINPSYNPDEAEEIITAKWHTKVGITVTRTSRAWSYPDFDDMIIYEYELEYTGETKGLDPKLPGEKRTADLVDVLFTVNYGLSPSMLGYQRWYGQWKYDDGMWRQDQRSSFDPDYFLTYMTTTHTGSSDEGVENLMGKPEPDPDLFYDFASTGKNGGGLLSAQAPGYCWLYWDIDHLAKKNETEYYTGNYYLGDFEFDANDHVKQPFQMKTGSGNTRESKMEDRATTMDERWWTVYGESGVAAGEPSDGGRFVIPDGTSWTGRARFEWDECYNGVMVSNGMGPYNMSLGDKLEFAYAEVVGYGGPTGKVICGGQRDKQFFPVRSLNKPVVINGDTLTRAYLDDFGYPEHVNSDVINVDQVAHKAWEAYLGHEIPYDPVRQGPVGGMLWPEQNPKPSANTEKYKIPVTVPAPIIVIDNTIRASVSVTWNTSAEQFTHPRMSGTIVAYKIWRSELGSGPYEELATVNVGTDVNGIYSYEDLDQSFNVGETRYYTVTSVDNAGYQSGRTNITKFRKAIKSVDKLSEVYVVPNPFYLNSLLDPNNPNRIGFYKLPSRCTIRIYSYAGQHLDTIEHTDPVYDHEWFQVTRNDQDIASGVYFYVVTTPEGSKTSGKFVIIK